MNISINFAKTTVVGAILLLAFSAVFVANAAVTLTSATINGGSSAIVASGASVTVNVAAAKTGSGCENNWRATVVSVDGDVVHTENLGSITGTGSVSDSFSFTAPAVAGDYEVLVEVMGGGEAFGDTTCSDVQVWDTETLSLTVYEPVASFIQVLDLDPANEVRIVGDTNPLTYTAEVQIGGVPTSAHLQCVIFDIFRGDAWNTVAVDFATAGTYDEEDGISFTYDISTYATGTYPVNVVALDVPCDELPEGFDTADYLDSDTSETDETTLTIIDPVVVPPSCQDNEVSGNVWGDEDQNDVLSEGEVIKSGWIVKISDSEGVEFATTETDAEGDYNFCVPDGTWKITQTSLDGWTYSYPDDGEWVITFDAPVISFVDQVISFFVPTAHAAVAVGNNNLNFGVFQRAAAYSQGSYSSGGGNGRNISLRDDNDDSSSDDEEEEGDEPEGEVLGEATSVIPAGAPATGAGGASPLSVELNILTAILAVRSRKEVV